MSLHDHPESFDPSTVDNGQLARWDSTSSGSTSNEVYPLMAIHAKDFNAENATFNSVNGDQYNISGTPTYNNAHEALRRVNVPEAKYDSDYRLKSCPPCDSDTRTDILLKIRNALHDPDDPSMCLLYGKAGMGKSAIAQSIAQDVAVRGSLGASFFFDRHEAKLCKTNTIIPSIIWQLSFSVPALRQHIYDVIDKDETVLHASFDTQLKKLVIDPLKFLPDTHVPNVIIFDGLDECDEPGQMVELIRHLAPKFRLFITTRPETPIKIAFETAAINPIASSGFDLEDCPAKEDIRLFFQRTLYPIFAGWSLTLSTPNLDFLVDESGGEFIYATTLAKFLDDKDSRPDKQLEVILSDGPTQTSSCHGDINRLYRHILARCRGPKDSLRIILGAIVLARTPLTPRQLSVLLGVDFTTLEVAFKTLHSILSIPADLDDEKTVTPYHVTLHDFLTVRERADAYFIDPLEIHNQFVLRSLERISTLPSCGFPSILLRYKRKACVTAILDQMEGGLRSESSSQLRAMHYACNYWTYHLFKLAEGSLKDVPDRQSASRLHFWRYHIFKSVEGFLKYGLYWFPRFNSGYRLHYCLTHLPESRRQAWREHMSRFCHGQAFSWLVFMKNEQLNSDEYPGLNTEDPRYNSRSNYAFGEQIAKLVFSMNHFTDMFDSRSGYLILLCIAIPLCAAVFGIQQAVRHIVPKSVERFFAYSILGVSMFIIIPWVMLPIVAERFRKLSQGASHIAEVYECIFCLTRLWSLRMYSLYWQFFYDVDGLLKEVISEAASAEASAQNARGPERA